MAWTKEERQGQDYVLYKEIRILTNQLAKAEEETLRCPSFGAFSKWASIKNEIEKRKNLLSYLDCPERLNKAIRWFVSCPEYTEGRVRQIYFFPSFEHMETIYEEDGVKIQFTPNGYVDFLGLCEEEIEEVKKIFAIDDNNVINSYLKEDSL